MVLILVTDLTLSLVFLVSVILRVALTKTSLSVTAFSGGTDVTISLMMSALPSVKTTLAR